MRFKTFTLGCKVNQYESQFTRTVLLMNGGEEVPANGPDPDPSVDLIFVNTCSVTSESDAKSRKMITGAARHFPNAEIVVMGCFAAHSRDLVLSMPNVRDVICDKGKLNDYFLDRGWTNIPSGIHDFEERHRAYIKIQDGCRVGCAYCIIPKVRPHLKSRPIEEIAAEVIRLDKNQYREIVLTGIHLGHYGIDLAVNTCNDLPLSDYLNIREHITEEKRVSLAGLLDALMKIPFEARIRLGSLEAVEVSDQMLDIMADHQDRICPHFHLSMQSGDDTVLRRMKRRWMSTPYREKCEKIKEKIPDAALTTDVIVGFPGETEDQFLNTCSMVERIGFSKVHLFRYSSRPDTEAARMPDQVPEPEKKRRLAHLSEIARRRREDYARSCTGRQITLLAEDCVKGSPSVLIGTAENYLTVHLPLDSNEEDPSRLIGQLIPVHIEKTDGDILLGKR
ncbi:MAG: MiaB/RimO family radical SAM methylthiotransferase [Planctomycetia bacterium]|nr:MiaB/RimO family radical SAM methylthiotransferase [Planctomycetia bacterium]